MKNRGLWIPEEILADKNFTWLERVIVATVLSLSGGGGCTAGNKYLAEMCECNAEKISRTLTKAERLEYITIERGEGLVRTVKGSCPYGQRVLSKQTRGLVHTDKEVLSIRTKQPENLPIIYNNKQDNKTYITQGETVDVCSGGDSAPEKGGGVPTVDTVREYCTERANGIDAEAFCDYYSARGWVINGSPVRDWRALVRGWERRQTGTPARGSGDAVFDFFTEVANGQG